METFSNLFNNRWCSYFSLLLTLGVSAMSTEYSYAGHDEHKPSQDQACKNAMEPDNDSNMTSRPVVPTLRGTDMDHYYGVDVPDPYRWLEDMDSAEVENWIDQQNAATQSHLSQLQDRGWFTERLRGLMNYPREGLVFSKGGRYFVYRNTGLQNQSVLYSAPTATGPWSVLLDPNQLAADGTVSVGALSVSPNGTYIAYALNRSGLDQQEWRVREVATGRDLPETLYSKFSGASWAKDESGFYYSRYPRQEGFDGVDLNNKVYFHRLNTAQESDALVFEQPDHPDWMFVATVTDDGSYLVITTSRSTMPLNKVYIKNLKQGHSGPVHGMLSWPPLGDFDAAYEFIGNRGSKFFFKTTKQAPNGKVMAIELTVQGALDVIDVIPHGQAVLKDVLYTDHGLYAHRLQHASSRLERYSLDGARLGDVQLPGIGSLGAMVDNEDGTIGFSFSGFTQPSANFRFDGATQAVTETWRPELTFDPSHYVTEQHFVTSGDGTQVPVFVVHKKGLVRDGTNPTYLYGYGGFNISLTPSFSASNMAWLERGGVYVVANLRGGGEYGEEWHHAGMRERKQNVFNDFIASAEWLISRGYTSSRHLAVGGGSNGGLLVGAVITQRPELFRAAVPAVGVLDMLRYQLFSAGRYWTEEYGAVSDSPEAFRWLLAYSPYHNAGRHSCYPATMILTGDHDDRVVPLHSYKFAAALQYAQRGPLPILLRVERDAGHGAGKPIEKVIAESADKWAFLWAQLTK
jgi:prolyl oligopeptidase